MSIKAGIDPGALLIGVAWETYHVTYDFPKSGLFLYLWLYPIPFVWVEIVIRLRKANERI